MCPLPSCNRPLRLHSAARALLALVLLLSLSASAETPGQDQYDFANGLFHRGFYKEAIEEYRSYLERFPDEPHAASAWYRLGVSYQDQKSYEEALAALEKAAALESDPITVGRVRVQQGSVLHALNRNDEAKAMLSPLTAEGVEPQVRGEALYRLGKLYFDTNSSEEAITTFRALADALPDNPFTPFAQYQLAFVYLKSDALEEAATRFSAVAASSAEESLRMESRFRAAEAYDKLGWFESAVGAYEQLRAEFPDSDYARRADYGYAWALYHAGQFAKAAESAAAFIAAQGNAAETPGLEYLRGNCLQQQKQYDAALGVYTGIRERYPDSDFAGRALYKIAWVHHLRGANDEARKQIRQFLDKFGELPLAGDAAFLLGTIEMAEENYSDAYEEFRLVTTKFAKAEFAPEALYKSGECLVELGRSEEAAATFETFAKQYPSNPLAEQAILKAGDADFSSASFEDAVAKYKALLTQEQTPAIEQETLYRLAITYHNMRDYALSAATFSSLVSKYPESMYRVEGELRLGDALLRQSEEGVKALEHYQFVLNAEPEGKFAGRALRGMALARLAANDQEGAATTMLEVVRRFPNQELGQQTYAWLGAVLYKKEDWAGAADAYAQLLRRHPEVDQPHRYEMLMAKCYERTEKTDEALRLYARVIETAPETGTAGIEARFRMAELFAAQENYKRAIELLQEAADTNSGDYAAQARFRLGELNEKRGNFEEAARNYMRVAILFVSEELSPKALYRAAYCFEQAGQADRAKDTYDELLREYPEAPQAGEAKQRLEGLVSNPAAAGAGNG